ncbi:hypothetical protein GDO81_000479 [Engystomops pustulosus]|uniref:Uncharacterized protein n=1 Tax=Engystomops pustulosus TaxID=76066 RepID=A0AAV7D6R3_ENGPU|nr:hypothetical protein GDO81_000479 [Engystomops pustulosus]
MEQMEKTQHSRKGTRVDVKEVFFISISATIQTQCANDRRVSALCVLVMISVLVWDSFGPPGKIILGAYPSSSLLASKLGCLIMYL